MYLTRVHYRFSFDFHDNYRSLLDISSPPSEISECRAESEIKSGLGRGGRERDLSGR